jgi:hypothetical protein
MIILAPEIGVALAMDQNLFARESQEDRGQNEGETVVEDSLNGGTSEGKAVTEKEGQTQIEEKEKAKEISLNGGTSNGKLAEERSRQTGEEETNTEKLEDEIDKVLIEEGFVDCELYPEGFFGFSSPRPKNIPRRHEISKTHAFLANMGGLRIKIVFPSYQQKDEITRPLELLLPNWKSLGQY